MKYLIIAVLFLSGCASSPEWDPESVAPKSVEVHFVAEESWNGGDFIDTDKALIGGAFSGGVADFRGDTCHIYFPAHRGIPDRDIMRHELRHCFEGGHMEWD